MKKIENKEKISNIYFTRSICPFCPLGEDYYNAEVSVDFDVGDSYPDYIEVDTAIQELSGKSLTIEQVCEEVFKIMKEFEPRTLSVHVDAKSNKHFPVTVSKNF